MPRRPALIYGTFGCAVFLAINGGLSARWAQLPEDNKNLALGQGAVASYFLFSLIFSFAYTPLQALYPVEVLTTSIRAKGVLPREPLNAPSDKVDRHGHVWCRRRSLWYCFFVSPI